MDDRSLYDLNLNRGAWDQPLVSLGRYTAKTFLWMVLGLLITFGTAMLCWTTGATVYALYTIPYIHMIVLVATLALSLTMSLRIEKMSVASARGIFIAFSLLFGFTLSIYLLILAASSWSSS